MDSKTLMIIMGGTGIGKGAVVKAVTKIMNETVQHITSVLRFGTTGTADFVISGATFHYVLGIPINHPINYLNGSKIQHLQQCLYGINIIIIDEISMMEIKFYTKLTSDYNKHLANVQNHSSGLLFFWLFSTNASSW